MKSFLLLLALLISVPTQAQERLVFQAKITMSDKGEWSGFSKWYPGNSYGGQEIRTFVVQFDDTISLADDSISQAILDIAGAYKSHLTAIFDRGTNTVHQIQITGSGWDNFSGDGGDDTFTISIDSLATEQLSGSVLTVTPGTYISQTMSKYSWSHPGPPESQSIGGSDITGSSGSGSDSGSTDFVVPDATSGVTSQNPSSAFHITYLGGGAVQIEGVSSSPNEQIDIFDELGRRIYRTRFDGNSVLISNLHSGCYFAHVGNINLKFFVSE